MTSVDDNDTVQIVPDPDKLFVYHRQQLSAMLDGELSPDQAKFMLRRLQHDGELAACWERWQVCGDMLRGQRNDLLPADFAQRVSLALGAGGTAVVDAARPHRGPRPRFARWGGGAAVAASVALMAVFVGRQLPDAAPAPVDAPARVVAAGAPAPLAQPEAAVAAAPAAPAPVLRIAETPASDSQRAAAVAAAAVAAAAVDTPRRASQRRARSQASAAAQAPEQAPMIAAADTPLPPPVLVGVPDASGPDLSGYAFAMPEASARPWPRSLLAPQGGLAVSSGGLLPRPPDFEPLLPGARTAPWPTSEPQAGAVQP